MKFRILVYSALLLSTLSSRAYDFTLATNGYNIYYNITSDTTVEVTFKDNYAGSDKTFYRGTVEIPETVVYNGNTYRVTAIGNSAFQGCTELESIAIPPTVSTIGYDAFTSCIALTSITFPESVRIISYAFKNCKALETVYFNCQDCVMCGSYNTPAFSGCDNLEELVIGDSATRIPDFAFRGLTTLKTVTIGEGIERVGDRAFENCTGIETLNFNATACNTLTQAFDGCKNITTLNIGDKVKRLPDNAFEYLENITEVTIPEGLEYLGASTFGYCYGLKTVNFNAINCSTTTSDEWWNPQPFAYCAGITTVNFGDRVTTIPARCFYSCEGLTSIIIPESVTSIGGSAFGGCKSLTEIAIPSTVTSIGSSAFARCSKLTSIELPESITEIPIGAFEGCTLLSSVNLNNEIKKIGAYAFNECSSLTSVDHIIAHADTIGSGAFWRCKGLTTITLPECLKELNYYSFNGCSNLERIVFNATKYESAEDCYNVFRDCPKITEVSIGDAVTIIPEQLFAGFKAVKSLTIPFSVREIRWGAFAGCTALDVVLVDNPNPESIKLVGQAFNNLPATCTLYVPRGSKELYAAAPQWYYFKFIEEFGMTPGDSNGDGSLDAQDIAYMIDHILGQSPEGIDTEAADLNADGTIDAQDIAALILLILGE